MFYYVTCKTEQYTSTQSKSHNVLKELQKRLTIFVWIRELLLIPTMLFKLTWSSERHCISITKSNALELMQPKYYYN